MLNGLGTNGIDARFRKKLLENSVLGMSERLLILLLIIDGKSGDDVWVCGTDSEELGKSEYGKGGKDSNWKEDEDESADEVVEA
jgi:hypothetical protein